MYVHCFQKPQRDRQDKCVPYIVIAVKGLLF